MPVLALTPDELLSTTRAVRKRLDFDRPVEPALIRECLELAIQAPSGSNAQGWHFVVVTDAERRRGLAELYRRAYDRYRQLDGIYIGSIDTGDPDRRQVQLRSASSADYLAENLHRAPVLLVPCVKGRTDGAPALAQAGTFGSIFPATWSFMLAARARGLGTAWTSLHLMFEREAAELLGIPYDEVMQTSLTPVAYTKGTDFKPAKREPVDTVVHWDAW